MPTRKRIAYPLAVLLFLTVPLPARANPYEHTLSNGLRVIVREDRRAPTAVHMVWYRAGGMDEVSGTTGVAHVLEHMMFKGTPNVGAGEFSRRVAAAGGRDNAFTSKDYTAYFQQVPKERLAQMMQLEADRMRHLNLDAGEFAQEIKVVMEERRQRTDDSPHARLGEQLTAVAYQTHPYRVPVIGWMNDLENMTVQDARDWYRRWYAPNNACVVVVGDVDHQAVFKLAEKYYGRVPARTLSPRKEPIEPEQAGIRRFTLRAEAELPVLIMAYKVPVLRDVENDVDPYALEMLAAVLDGHDAARLTTHLIREQQLAVSAGASYDSLARARAQLVAGQVYKLDSMFAQAMEIGQLEAVGIANGHGKRIIEKFQAVTAEAVQAVARKYFVDERLTVAELDPLPSAPLKEAGQ